MGRIGIRGNMVLHELVAGGLYEFKRRRIHAVTQSGRLGAIIEHVPKMRTAPGARDLSAARISDLPARSALCRYLREM